MACPRQKLSFLKRSKFAEERVRVRVRVGVRVLHTVCAVLHTVCQQINCTIEV